MKIALLEFLLKKSILLSLVILALVFPGAVHSQEPAILVDTSTSYGSMKNMAGGINFWGQKEAQERFIKEVGTYLYRFKMRLHKVEKKAGGYTRFPWEGDDVTPEDMTVLIQNLNLAKTKGCKIIVQMYGIPNWLSTSRDERIITNNLPNYAKYPPKDFVEWAKLVFTAIRELKRLGLEGIDYYEIFGEPNVGSTWYEQTMPCRRNGDTVLGCEQNELGHNTLQVMKNFLKVYKYTVKGIRAADPEAKTGKIGGVAIIPTPDGIWWTRLLAKYAKLYNLPLDFYSWHWYGIDEAMTSIFGRIEPHKPLTIDLIRRRLKTALRNKASVTFK